MNIIISLKSRLKSSPMLTRVITAIVFGVGGSVGSRALIVLSGVIVSRILGKDLYGKFSMVNSTVTLFVTFSGMGIGATLTRYVALYRDEHKKLGSIIQTLSTFVTLFSTLMSITVFILSKSISLWVSGTDTLTNYFKIASITIFSTSLASIQQSILLGMERYKTSALIDFIQCGIYLVLSPILSYWKSVNGAIWSLFISHTARFILMYIQNKKQYRANGTILKFSYNSEIKEIVLKFTVPAFTASLFVFPVNWINNAILAKQVGFGELAIFSVALQWMTIITYIPSQMGQIKPIYTDLFAKRQYTELKSILRNITLSSIGLVTPFIFFGICFSKQILILYGNEYETGYITFILMLVAAFLITAQSQVGAFLQAIGKMWTGFVLNLIWSIVLISVFYYYRQLGSKGYAIAYCFAYGVHLFISYIAVFFIWNKGRRS